MTGLVAQGAQHVAFPGLGPIAPLRRRARHARLQLLPQGFEALDVAGDAEPDLAEAGRYGYGPCSLDRPSCDLGIGAEKGSRTHTQHPSLKRRCRRSAWQSFCNEHLSNLRPWIKTMPPEQG